MHLVVRDMRDFRRARERFRMPGGDETAARVHHQAQYDEYDQHCAHRRQPTSRR